MTIPLGEKADTLGFIGLGDMGGGIAGRLLATGHVLTVWDLSRERVTEFVSQGAMAAQSAAAVGSASTWVGICVNDDRGVREVVTGPNGLLTTMTRGKVIAVHSTVLPSTVKALAEAASAKGVAVLDAPVSGGRKRALVGQLSVMCGGDPAIYERGGPILEAIATMRPLLGGIGAGQTMKLINNNLTFSHMGLGLHALQLAERFGLDRKIAAETILASGGSSRGFGRILEVLAELGQMKEGSSMGKDHAHFMSLLAEAEIDDDFLGRTARRGTEIVGAARGKS